MMRNIVLALACALLSGCLSAQVTNASSDGISLKRPFVGSGGAEGKAAEHCARYGKKAIFQGKLASPEDNFIPILVFDCQ